MNTEVSEPAVSCTGVVKDFTTGRQVLRVLQNINLKINPGQLTLVTGPSGCGKTTLISILGGILSPTAGKINVFGNDLGSMSEKRRSAFRLQQFGFIFQQLHLLTALTAVENVALTLCALGRSRPSSMKDARDLLGQLGMSEHLAKQPRQLSGGQQQRVAIARALVHQPRFIICDEPTSALDAKTGRAVMELIGRLAVRPTSACIVVTHDPRIEGYANRILRMEDGKIIEDNHK